MKGGGGVDNMGVTKKLWTNSPFFRGFTSGFSRAKDCGSPISKKVLSECYKLSKF